jgi:hypothetical protein
MDDELIYGFKPATVENDRHIWSVVGPAGGVHIWAAPSPWKPGDRFYGQEMFYGGIEVHSRTPMYGDHASQDECWLIGGPCWHDGSSLYFSESIEPRLRGYKDEWSEGVHEYMRFKLFDWYQSNLAESGP